MIMTFHYIILATKSHVESEKPNNLKEYSFPHPERAIHPSPRAIFSFQTQRMLDEFSKNGFTGLKDFPPYSEILFYGRKLHTTIVF